MSAVLPVEARTERAIAIDRIDRVAEFEALAAPWRELLLASSSDCLFVTWEWMFTWWQHFGAGRQLALYVGHNGSQLELVAPFAARRPQFLRGRPWSTLELLGAGNVGSDYLDILVRRGGERQAAERLADRLRRDRAVLSIPRIHADAASTRLLADSLGAGGWLVDATDASECPYITLAAHTWDSYLASLGREHRSNFRRRLRKLHERFDVRLDRVAAEHDRQASLQTLIDLHNQRWDGRGGSTAFHTPALVQFHRTFSRVALERGWLRLYVLHLNGVAAAALYGFRYGETFLFYQSGFDSRFAEHGVGLVLMGLVIREAIAEGAAEFDLLHGAEPYKFLWAAQSRELSNVEFYPPTARGIVTRRLTDCSRAARAALRRVAPAPRAS